MDKTTQALKKLFELSRRKKNDEVLEKIVKDAGQLSDIKIVLRRLFSAKYSGSIENYTKDIRKKLKTDRGSVAVALTLSEYTRILKEFQERGPDWYGILEQEGYLG